MPVAPDPDIFVGGTMTSLPAYAGTVFVGTELMEIVSPGNAAEGVNWQITTAQLAALLNGFSYVNTIITSGAVIGNPYIVPVNVTRVLVDKATPSATEIEFLASANYPMPVLVRDILGDASGNPITVTFANGETCDGLSSVQISSDYGGYVFNPLKTGGWYLGSA